MIYLSALISAVALAWRYIAYLIKRHEADREGERNDALFKRRDEKKFENYLTAHPTMSSRLAAQDLERERQERFGLGRNNPNPFLPRPTFHFADPNSPYRATDPIVLEARAENWRNMLMDSMNSFRNLGVSMEEAASSLNTMLRPRLTSINNLKFIDLFPPKRSRGERKHIRRLKAQARSGNTEAMKKLQAFNLKGREWQAVK